MSASPEPTGDAELTRLLDAYNDSAIAYGQSRGTGNYRAMHAMDAARALLLSYLAATYVRRDAIHTTRLTGRGPARAARYSKEELADGD